MTEVEDAADSIAQSLFSHTQPVPVLVSACRSCDFFGSTYLGSGLAHTVLEIPKLHISKLRRLSCAGIIDLSKIPNDLDLNERQNRAKSAALSEKVIVEKGLSAALATIEWPCQYLDFETVATFSPIYNGHGCHEQVMTQFSIHHRDSMNAEWSHSEYLADAAKDCERELAEGLIEKLQDRGSILVYGNFEATRIRGLADRFPELKEPLLAIVGRLRTFLQLLRTMFTTRISEAAFQSRRCFPLWYQTFRMRVVQWQMEMSPSHGLLSWPGAKSTALPQRLPARRFFSIARWTRWRWFGCTKSSNRMSR